MQGLPYHIFWTKGWTWLLLVIFYYINNLFSTLDFRIYRSPKSELCRGNGLVCQKSGIPITSVAIKSVPSTFIFLPSQLFWHRYRYGTNILSWKIYIWPAWLGIGAKEKCWDWYWMKLPTNPSIHKKMRDNPDLTCPVGECLLNLFKDLMRLNMHVC